MSGLNIVLNGSLRESLNDFLLYAYVPMVIRGKISMRLSQL